MSIAASTERYLRDRLGLTQVELSCYLGVSRELLAATETGRRELPPQALFWLHDLLRLSELPPAFGGLAEPELPPEAPGELPTAPLDPVVYRLDALRQRLARCEREAANLAFRLPGLREQMARNQRLRKVAAALQAALPPAPPEEGPLEPKARAKWHAESCHHLGVRMMVTRATVEERKCNPADLLLLEARQAALAAEIGVLKRALGES